MHPQNIPNEPGAYQLVLDLPQEVVLQVGALGRFRFPAGRYVYTGSALGGLRARVGRHLYGEKRLRWHIDYLLPHARVEEIRLFPTQERIECDLNRQLLALPDARVVARGFGSSDCRCPAHLVYLGGEESSRQPITFWEAVSPPCRQVHGTPPSGQGREAGAPRPTHCTKR